MILDKSEVMLINRLLLDYKNELLLSISNAEKIIDKIKVRAPESYYKTHINWKKDCEGKYDKVNSLLTKLYEYYDDFNNLD